MQISFRWPSAGHIQARFSFYFGDGRSETWEVTNAATNADMDSLTPPHRRGFPKSTGWGATSIAQTIFISPETIKNLWLLMGAVGFFCLDRLVTGQSLARGTVAAKRDCGRGRYGATRCNCSRSF